MNEYKNLVTWLTSPFDTTMPMWKLFLVFVMFLLVGFVVIDNLDMFKKGLQA